MPRFIATMDSSDFCAAFAPQTSQVHNATFQTRRPSMPRHAFRAANRLRRFFSASRILRRWPHGSLGVTRLNGKGSLTLRLTCLSDRASTVGSPLPPPVFLTDCRFLVSTNSFHFVSSIALLGAPKFPLIGEMQVPLKDTSAPATFRRKHFIILASKLPFEPKSMSKRRIFLSPLWRHLTGRKGGAESAPPFPFCLAAISES